MPAGNLLPLPASMTHEAAATLGTTYLTAYRMLATRSRPARRVDHAGAGRHRRRVHRADPAGRAGGMRVWATSRTEAGRDRAADWARTRCSRPGARLPERVDGVFESVGKQTWAHSMRAVRPGGVVVCCGATSGADPSADLQRLFFLQISVIGSTMGTLDEMRRLIAFCAAAERHTGGRPDVSAGERPGCASAPWRPGRPGSSWC